MPQIILYFRNTLHNRFKLLISLIDPLNLFRNSPLQRLIWLASSMFHQTPISPMPESCIAVIVNKICHRVPAHNTNDETNNPDVHTLSTLVCWGNPQNIMLNVINNIWLIHIIHFFIKPTREEVFRFFGICGILTSSIWAWQVIFENKKILHG